MKSIGHIDLPHEGRALLKRARATADQRLAVNAPTIKKSVAQAAQAPADRVSMDLTIPVDEIVALMEYVAALIVQVEGVDGCVWGEMSKDEKVDWLDEMGASAIMAIYLRYLWLRVTVDQPEVVRAINEKIAQSQSEPEPEPQPEPEPEP